MERHPPRTTSDEIDLYIRTYYSLLRSSGEVHVSAFEEAHVFSNSSLHPGAREAAPDVAAFAYSAARLPACMPRVTRMVMGQSHESFEAAGMDVRAWESVRTRGRRRPSRWDGQGTLGVFVTSTSDIDDLVPIVTAYQIEWNKMHASLARSSLGRSLAARAPDAPMQVRDDELATALELNASDTATLRAALAPAGDAAVRALATRPSDLIVRLLSGSFSQYQRAAQRWWSGIEPHYLREREPRRPPVYFVSSNTHALANLFGGYARAHQERIIAFARRADPENLSAPLDEAIRAGDDAMVSNLTYYLLRAYLREAGDDELARMGDVQAFDRESGIASIESPGRIDVGAQVIELAKLRPERMDPRVRVPGIESLTKSEAVIINIDYPLGMAAYHHLSRVGQGAGEIRGIYVMGKAASLNARVGDVMISTVAHDEHSRNTYLFRNCFTASDVQPLMRLGNVLDNQKALTVRSAFLQNREYMSVFYREGYTVLEMEAGPYLAAVYELVHPNRYPNDEVVHLSNITPFDVGILHYASDTPYSRRQSLLSKSLSYFGMDSTYGAASAIVQRIFRAEIERLAGRTP